MISFPLELFCLSPETFCSAQKQICTCCRRQKTDFALEVICFALDLTCKHVPRTKKSCHNRADRLRNTGDLYKSAKKLTVALGVLFRTWTGLFFFKEGGGIGFFFTAFHGKGLEWTAASDTTPKTSLTLSPQEEMWDARRKQGYVGSIV